MCVSFFTSLVHVGAPCRMKVLARFTSSGCSFPTWPDQDSSEDFSVLDDQMPCPVLAPRPSPLSNPIQRPSETVATHPAEDPAHLSLLSHVCQGEVSARIRSWTGPWSEHHETPQNATSIPNNFLVWQIGLMTSALLISQSYCEIKWDNKCESLLSSAKSYTITRISCNHSI